MYDLYIANENYSSWSLRPWALMRELGVEFREHLVPFGQESMWRDFRKISPSGKVPCLKETLRDQPHEEEIARMGKVLEDLRAK